MNELGKSGHWGKDADSTSQTRRDACLLTRAEKVPKLDFVYFEIVHHVDKANKGRRPDVLACAPTVKAAIDGIVDAKILEDDGPEFVRGINFLPICICDKNFLEIIIREV